MEDLKSQLAALTKEREDREKALKEQAKKAEDEAKKKAGRSAKTVHRSIHLTTFGEDFCRLCLPGAEPRAD